MPNDPGITWAELATSFTIASGLQLPSTRMTCPDLSPLTHLKLYFIPNIINPCCVKPLHSAILSNFSLTFTNDLTVIPSFPQTNAMSLLQMGFQNALAVFLVGRLYLMLPKCNLFEAYAALKCKSNSTTPFLSSFLFSRGVLFDNQDISNQSPQNSFRTSHTNPWTPCFQSACGRLRCLRFKLDACSVYLVLFTLRLKSFLV